jgi:antitoxin component YwqK of YwqJK toxin-antitoxin module
MRQENTYQSILPPEWETAIDLSELEERISDTYPLVYIKDKPAPYTGCAKAVWRSCEDAKESDLVFFIGGQVKRRLKFRYGIDPEYVYSQPLELEFDILFKNYPLSYIGPDFDVVDLLGDSRVVAISVGDVCSWIGPHYISCSQLSHSFIKISQRSIYYKSKKNHSMALEYHVNGRPSLLRIFRGERFIEAVGWNPDGSFNATSIVGGTGFLKEYGDLGWSSCYVQESHWLNGKLNGVFCKWDLRSKDYSHYRYDSTNILYDEEGKYLNGYKEGLWRNRHGNGQIRSECNYSNGKKNGIYKYWSYEGELKNIENYKQGILQAES